MTTDDDYKQQLARIRRMLGGSVTTGGPLPANLRPENIKVSEDTVERARRIRGDVLRGDADAVRAASPELLSAGFDRNATDDAIPELDEARERVRKRLSNKEGADDVDTSRGRRNDSE